MRDEEVLKKLYDVCGLEAKLEQADENACDGVCVNEAENRTTVTVATGAKTLAFSFAGTDRVVAALAREYVLSALGKTAVDTMHDFLTGSGQIPTGVHIGKDDYYVFAVYGADRHSSVYNYILAMAATSDFVADMDENITAFCKKIDNDNDYQSAGEFALVLHENITEEIDCNVKIGVGGVAHGVSELPLYYGYARSALISGAEFDANSSIYSYKEYALIKILSELPEVTMEKYVKTVLDKNYRAVLSDTELMTAADMFLKHSLNISEASRSMYVHRNTLIYRLDKIEKMTGLNIRNFNDAMTFRVAYLIYKML